MSKTAAEWAEEIYINSGRVIALALLERRFSAAMAQASAEGEERGRREMREEAATAVLEVEIADYDANVPLAKASLAIRNLPDKASR